MKFLWKHLRHGFRFPSCQIKINSGCEPFSLSDESTFLCKRGNYGLCVQPVLPASKSAQINAKVASQSVDSGLLSHDKTCWYDISAAEKNDLKSFRSFTGQFFWVIQKTDQQCSTGFQFLSSHFAASGTLGFMTLRYLSMTGDLRNLCEVESWILWVHELPSKDPGEWYQKIHVFIYVYIHTKLSIYISI